MSKPENPSAFPRTGEGFGNPMYDAPGMTLRDWFAGQALAGQMAAEGPTAEYDEMLVVVRCYRIADYMLTYRDPAYHMPSPPNPCGGCGAERDSQRCLGCFHDFGTPESEWIRRGEAIPPDGSAQ